MVDEISKTAQVYIKLRTDLLAGVYPPNHHLEVHALCRRYAITEMPVRLALNRAVGSGLVEERDGHGFYTPRAANAVELEEVFHSNHGILIHSPRRFINRRPLVPYTPTFAPEDSVVKKTECLFLGIAGLAGPYVMFRAMQMNNFILHALRTKKSVLIDNLDHEIDGLIEIWRRFDMKAWEASVNAYTDRRLKMVSDLAWLTQQSA